MTASRARSSSDRSAAPAGVETLQRRLLAWYREAHRDLPWRRTRDPYAIWVSEVMLQQTQVKTAIGYYERWMRRFPTLQALAAADEADVLHAFQGLGYYSRARNLQRGARAVVDEHGGTMPRTAASLRELPGVGAYTSGAIASIAFGEPTPVVDGNVVRVLCRLFGLRGDPARAPLKGRLWDLATELVAKDDPSHWNQALMELGATICTPRAARCDACPLASACVARREDTVDELPETAKRPATVAVERVLGIVRSQGRVLVTQVPADAKRWASMWQFPNADLAKGEAATAAVVRAVREATGLEVRVREHLKTIRHAVTFHRIQLHGYDCELTGKRRPAALPPRSAFRTRGELDSLPMPSAHRRFAALL